MNSKVHRRLELLETRARKARIKGLRGGVAAEINITPLVDVVLVLLIIFMLVLPKMDVAISLPAAFNPEKITAPKNPPINVNIKLGNLVSVNEEPFAELDEAKLKALLEKELKKDPFATVYLAADENLQFKDVRTILSALRDAGVAQAGLVSKRIVEQEK